ncbi:MAG: ATPase domain-containing protein [Candidatus Thermoplasmatota archaeon]|nr:ATPase domain-containing protein [Candidatus Thermoplasmatota archaeon]
MRIKTYVEGFDELLSGGIPHGSVVLISGTTGTMKSSFAYSILYNNARYGTKALYLALQQSEKNLLAQMENFGMTYENVAGSLYILDRYKIREGIEKHFKKTFFDTLLEHLLLLKQDFNYQLIAVDCLSALETISELERPRAEIFKFFEWLRKLDATSFLITEMSPDSKSYGGYDEGFLADGIIHLKMEEISEIKVQRRVKCVKLRTSLHSTDWYALFFSNGKFRVAEVISEVRE